MTTREPRPAAWAVLEAALRWRRPVRARYKGVERVLCPHALGWKDGRAKVLSYQSGGMTSEGPLPAEPGQRWRCMFVADVDRPELIEGSWRTWDNHAYPSTCFGQGEVEIDVTSTRPEDPDDR